jgi:subtilisin
VTSSKPVALTLGLLATMTLAVRPALAQNIVAPKTGAALINEVRQSNGRVIVVLRGEGGPAALRMPGEPLYSEAALDRVTVRLGVERGLQASVRAPALGILAGTVTENELAALTADPEVAFVEADRPWALQDTRDTPPVDDVPWGITAVTAPTAWTMTTGSTGSGIKVGVLDSGGDVDHPDLQWAGGYSTITSSTSSAEWDDNVAACNGHGTHVAGTIGARQNGIGVVGVAPNVQLYAIKVFEIINGSCQAWTSKQIQGLNWAVSQGIRVVNASIGGSYSAAYDAAIQTAASSGTFFVASAGNTGGSVLFPAASAYAFAVAAVDASNLRAPFSSQGPEVDFSGPGVGVYSTMPGGGYGNKSGTSMAAPHVAGVMALLLGRDPNLTANGIRQRLQDGALDLAAAGFDNGTGFGLVRAANSIEAMNGGGGGPPPVPLALAVSPTSRSASAQAGSAAPSDSATITLTGDNSSTTAWSASKRKAWTTLTTGSGTGSGRVRWSRSTSGLAAGTYVDTITVTAAGVAAQTVIDTLLVTAAPVPLTVAVSPTSRSATAQAGTAAPSDSATVTLAGDGSSTTAWSASKRKAWTTLTTGSGTGSGRVRWSRSTSGLAAGTYVDTITVSATGATAQRVIDTLIVTTAPVPLTLAVAPASRSTSAQAGAPVGGDSATVTLAGDNSTTTAWSTSKRKAWTTLTTGSGTGSGMLRWSRSTSGLTAGTYVDTLTVSAPGVAARTVIDTLIVTAAPVPLTLAVAPASRSATAQAGNSPPSDSATVTLAGDGSTTTAWNASKRKAWTTLTTGSGTGSGRVRWSRSTNGLSAGTYVDTITVSANGVDARRVIDTLIVTAAPVPLTLAVAPASRYASAQVGTATGGDSATVTLAGDNSSTAAWSATKRKAWTTLTIGAGTGSGMARWSRSTSGLATGTYVDTITVSASGVTTQRVIDTLVITSAPPPLAMSVAPGGFSNTSTDGAALSAGAATVSLSGTGAGTTAWSATSSRGSSFVTGSGVGTGTVAWNRNLATPAAGTYVDTITVSASGVSAQRIFDTLVVVRMPLAAAMTPTSGRIDVTAGSTAASNGSTQLTITGYGAATASWTAAKRKAWTTLAAAGGTGSATVGWSRNPTGLAAGTYVDTITVTVVGVAMPARFIDSLVVSAEPPPTQPLVISVSPTSRRVTQPVANGWLPDSANITLSGTGAASTTWTATALKSWESVQTTTGLGSAKLRWQRRLNGLAAGIYVDTITVAVSGGPTTRLVDTLVITLSTASSAKKTRSARMSGNATGGGSALQSPDTLVVQGTNLPWTATTGAGWLSLAATSGTGPGLVPFTRQVGTLAVGTYVDSIVVRETTTQALVMVHVDTLEIVEVAAPTPEVAVDELFRGGRLTTDQRTAFDGQGNRNGRYDLGDFLAWVERSRIRLSPAVVQQLMAAPPVQR